MEENKVTVENKYTMEMGDDKQLKLNVDGRPLLCYRNQVPHVVIDQMNIQKLVYVHCGRQCAKFKFGAPRDQKGVELPGQWASSNCGQFPLFYKIEESAPKTNTGGSILLKV